MSISLFVLPIVNRVMEKSNHSFSCLTLPSTYSIIHAYVGFELERGLKRLYHISEKYSVFEKMF